MAGEEDNEIGIGPRIDPPRVDQPFLHVDELVGVAARRLAVMAAAAEQLNDMVPDVLPCLVLPGTDERDPHHGIIVVPDD